MINVRLVKPEQAQRVVAVPSEEDGLNCVGPKREHSLPSRRGGQRGGGELPATAAYPPVHLLRQHRLQLPLRLAVPVGSGRPAVERSGATNHGREVHTT